jgi:sugar-phosphatase
MRAVIEKRMTTFHCSAILFDLDGVLVDSTGSVGEEWRMWARKRGVDEEKLIAMAHGVRAVDVIRTMAPHLDAVAEVRDLEAYAAAHHDGTVVMPGAVDLVRAIPEGRWGVVTSGSRNLSRERLTLAGIPIPKVMVTADDVIHGKPHPEPYLKAAERLGVNPAECLVIEDAPAGIRAAHAAGMKVVGLASTYDTSRLGEADAVAAKLSAVRVANGGPRKLLVTV